MNKKSKQESRKMVKNARETFEKLGKRPFCC